MVKRYALFYTDGGVMKNVIFPGQGAPLFEIERDAVTYINQHGYNFILILPTFVSKEVAEKQTIRLS